MSIQFFSLLLVPCKGTGTKSADMVKLEPMMKLVVHCIDRVRRFKHGKEVGMQRFCVWLQALKLQFCAGGVGGTNQHDLHISTCTLQN